MMGGRGGIGRRWRLKIFCPWRAGSSPAVRTIAAALALASCNPRPDNSAVVASVIGTEPRLADPSRGPLTAPDRYLTDAVAQGLVRFDATGQIEPGIAERWIVIDDGMSYIFRLRDAAWQDGTPVTARDVVAVLKRQLRRGSRNPLAPYLTAVDDIVEMTPEVIEVQLSRPRPDLLKLFAQPELAVFRLRPPGGSGPFRIAASEARTPLLAPVPDPNRASDEVRPPRPEDNVRLIGERAARAILRFADKRSDMVLGGTIADWRLLQQTQIAPANVRIDSAAGLFGLAVANRDGFLADAANRSAVAMAIDRAAIVAAVSPDWAATDQILPEQLDSAAPPSVAPWAPLSLEQRRAIARRQVAGWRAAHGEPPALRLTVPDGSGGTLLWGQLAASLIMIGIAPERARSGETADLRLIDSVAPYDSARWYLAEACTACGPEAQAALERARLAPTLAARAAAIAEADQAIRDDAAFIPIARPFRWSLVALRLRQWQANARAWHPLNRLRNDTK